MCYFVSELLWLYIINVIVDIIEIQATVKDMDKTKQNYIVIVMLNEQLPALISGADVFGGQ